MTDRYFIDLYLLVGPYVCFNCGALRPLAGISSISQKHIQILAPLARNILYGSSDIAL